MSLLGLTCCVKRPMPNIRNVSQRKVLAVLGGAGLAIGGGHVLAGGTPENILILVNPANAESMYLGHYYQNARNIPASNVLYIDPTAVDYPTMAGTNGNIDAVL